MTRMSATVAICTYNRHELLKKALESCEAQTLPKDEFEIIVVDNSSDRAAAEAFLAANKDIPNLNYVMEDRPGLSNARNVALEHARAPVICFLDDDAIAEPGWLGEIVKAFAAFKDRAGVVGGTIRPIWSVGRPSWLPKELEGPYTVVNWGGLLRIAEPDEWFAGANVSFAVEPLQRVGGFDVSLGRGASKASLLSNEESAAISAIEDLGYVRVFAPDAAVDHLVEPGRLNREWLRRRQAWQAISDLVMKSEAELQPPEQLWHNVSAFMNAVPPRHRTPAGLFTDFDDPETTKRQMSAVYSLTMMLTAAGGLETQTPPLDPSDA